MLYIGGCYNKQKMTYLNEEEIKQVITKSQKHVTASKNSYEDRLLKMKKEIVENVSMNERR